MLIAFEGIDASGKETQALMLKGWLESLGYRVSLYTYPDRKSDYGQKLALFLDKKINLSVDEQFALFASDIMKDQPEIAKKLKKGEFVLLDRYIASTLAYQCAQGYDFSKAAEWIEKNKPIKPDLCFLLDISAKTSFARKKKEAQPDIFEKNLSLLSSVREFYLRIVEAKMIAKRWVIVDAERKRDEVFEIIKSEVGRCLSSP